MRSLVTAAVNFVSKRIPFVNKLVWDYEYSHGQWDFLRGAEMKRLGVAKELLRKKVQNGNVLEVGCGEGVFFKSVLDINFGFYEGVDVSNVAIGKVTKTENSMFSVEDMETYHPKNAPFSIIIFNEVLYYSKNPLGLLVRYEDFLEEDGVFLIGMHSSPKSNQVWSEIDQHFAVRESTEVMQDDKTWHYKIIGAS